MKRSKMIFASISRQLTARPLFGHVLVFVLGMVIGHLTRLPLLFVIVLLAFSVILAVWGLRRGKYLLLFLFALTAGIFWVVTNDASQVVFPISGGGDVELSGMALGNAVDKDEESYSFYLQVESINGERPENKLKVLVYGNDEQKINYGDILNIRGYILRQRAFGNQNAFDYGQYLRRQGISATVTTAYGGSIVKTGEGGWPLLRGTGWLHARLDQAFEQVGGRQGVFLAGIFLGEKSELSAEEKETLVDTGIYHAFSVSGLHVGYILAIGMICFGSRRRHRYLRLIVVGMMLVFYALLAGMEAPVIRSVIMGLLALAALAFDEKADIYTSLAVSALICLLWHPLWLFDSGFQLSFVSLLGIAYLLPFFRELLPSGSRIGNLLRDSFAVTFAASWAAMPLIAYYFYNASFIGWLLSPTLLLLVGLAVMLCFAASILTLGSVFIATLPLYGAGALMSLVYKVADWAAALPGGHILTGRPPLYLLFIYYAALLILPLKLTKKELPLVLRAAMAVFFPLLIVLGGVLGLNNAATSVYLAGDILEVVFLDVGQGDSVLILTPQGNTLLIDGGGSRDSDFIGESVLVSYLKSRGIGHIDMVIASHPDIDHIGGLKSVFKECSVDYLLTADVFKNTSQKELEGWAREAGTHIVYTFQGRKYLLEPDLYLSIYSPPAGRIYGEEDSNNGSLVCKLSYRDIDFLFTGDIEKEAMKDISNVSLEAEVLKIPHHGSINCYDNDFYESVAPQAVVISVGANNSFGHPADKVVEYWKGKDIPLYRTDQNGAVSFFSDGRSLEVQTYID